MVGLVFIESLYLTPLRGLALGVNAAGWLWCFRVFRQWDTPPDMRFPPVPKEGQGGFSRLHPAGSALSAWCSAPWMLPALLLFSLLWVTFWNTPTTVDTWWLFDQAGELSHLPWPAFRDAVVNQLHIDKQVPFVTFWFARLPILWAQQLIWFPWALLCAGLMWHLYGRHAALLMATKPR